MNGVKLTTIHQLDVETYAQIDRLMNAAGAADGYDPLSEHKRMELTRAANLSPVHRSAAGVESSAAGVGSSVAGVGSSVAGYAEDADRNRPSHTLTAVLASRVGNSALMGYAQLDAVPAKGEYDVELVVHPRYRDPSLDLADRLLGTALDQAAKMSDGGAGGTIRYWAAHATPTHDALATSHGLTRERDLIQMRLTLPLGDNPPDIVLRPFVVGVDEDAWLHVNNRAFAGHPEQGNWTQATLLEREAEPWFDPGGFLLHEQDGRVVASCWTKVHTDTEPPMGEIYVISVDPEYRGRGLGRALTRAGLERLAQTGLRVGMLYVDADNPAAVSLYRSMGFTEDHTDRAYIGPLG